MQGAQDAVQTEAPPKADLLQHHAAYDSVKHLAKRITEIKAWKKEMHQIVRNRVKFQAQHRKDLEGEFKFIQENGVRLHEQFKFIHENGERLYHIIIDRAEAHHKKMGELMKSKEVHRDEANLMHLQLQLRLDERRAVARGQNADFSAQTQQIARLGEQISAERRAPAQGRDVVVPDRRIHAPQSVEAESAARPQDLLPSRSLQQITEGIIVNAFAAVDRGASPAPAIHELSAAVLHFNA